MMRSDAMRCDATRRDTDAMRCVAMRCDAMRCDAKRCDAMRSDAMRCDEEWNSHGQHSKNTRLVAAPTGSASGRGFQRLKPHAADPEVKMLEV